MFFNIFMTPIIWFNLLLCIASDNETSNLPNFDPYSGISDTFGFLHYLNFEPSFSSEFPSDPSQLIDFAQLSETGDISSEESKSETNQITNSPHPGFSDIYGHTNLELSDMDSYRNLWRDANEELKTSDDNVRYPFIRDAQNETSSSLNLNSDDIITYMHLPGSQQNAVPIYFHQLTFSSDDTSSQSATAEQSNIDSKHSDYLNILDYKENAYKKSETDKKNYTCYYPGCTVITKTRKEYLTHRKTHGQPFIYECKVSGCGRTFDHESTFYNHIQTHEPRPQCKDCGKFFTNRNALQKHKWLCETKSHERRYECLYPGCATVTKSYKEYIAHRKTHGQPFIYECRVAGCGRTFHHDSTLYYHKQTHEPHPQCERCGNFFHSMTVLCRHKRLCQIKSHGKSYECLYPGCTVIPTSRNEYVTHRKTHGQPFIYECRAPGCGRIFNSESSFRKHKETHTLHPQCEDCGKFFTTRNGLHKHKKICQTKSR
ncbi:Zinc finger C2H2 type family protein [Brugia pahangi]